MRLAGFSAFLLSGNSARAASFRFRFLETMRNVTHAIRKMIEIARGTPILTPVCGLAFWLAGWVDVELVGGIVDEEELCGGVGVEELVGEMTVRLLDVLLDSLDETVLRVVFEVRDPSIVESGYGSRAVVKWVVQQSTPPRPCPHAPAQHQIFASASHRFTSVKPWN